MATSLSRATSLARRSIIIFGVIAIISIFIQILSSGGILTPTPSGLIGVVPTGFKFIDLALGKLPHAQVQSFTLAPNTKAKFALDGKLSGFPSVVNVYTITKPRERLGNADRARKVAGTLGFNNIETSSEGDTLTWAVPARTRTFTYNKVLDKWSLKVSENDFAFKLKKGINQDPSFYDANRFSSLLNASLQINNSYFSSPKVFNDYINIIGTERYQSVNSEIAGYIKSSVFKTIESATFSTATSQNLSGIASEIRKPNYLEGQANFIVQGNLDKIQEDIIDFNYQDYIYDQVGVYPALTVEEAYNSIQANNGILYWLHLKNQSLYEPYQELNILEFRIEVARTKIVYIEPNEWIDDTEWTHYLHPFYLFEGTAITTDGNEAEFAFLMEAVRATEFK